MRADVFYRKWNTRRASTGVVLVEVAEDVSLVDIITVAGREEGKALERRQGCIGVYEVQTDKGVWVASDDGCLINFNVKRGARARPEARFATWEELEAQDSAKEKVMDKPPLNHPDVQALGAQPEYAVRELRALEVTQGARKLYLMGVDVKEVPRYATVSRVKREEGKLLGYQRPEQLKHIESIREYMESAKALMPNAVVLAFDSRSTFTSFDADLGTVRTGILTVPYPDEGAPLSEVSGFIIDGQQRLAAGRDAAVESFILPAVAFIDDSVAVQTDQFLRVNSVKPLPKALITELLPSTTGVLPPKLYARRLPAVLMERLNLDADSPLKGLIISLTNPKRSGKTAAKWGSNTGLIADNSLIRALQNSLSDGVLYQLVKLVDVALDEEEGIAEAMALLKRYWGVVRDTFPEAWGKDPKESRLFHGAGIITMSLMLDSICSLTKETQPNVKLLRDELELVAGDCRWTSGTWDMPGGKVAWNEVQNVSKDVARLATWLTTTYMTRRRALTDDGQLLPPKPQAKKGKKR